MHKCPNFKDNLHNLFITKKLKEKYYQFSGEKKKTKCKTSISKMQSRTAIREVVNVRL